MCIDPNIAGSLTVQRANAETKYFIGRYSIDYAYNINHLSASLIYKIDRQYTDCHSYSNIAVYYLRPRKIIQNNFV